MRTDNKTIEVTVCVATRNGSLYIEAQLRSIVAALDFALIKDYEIIITDDGSSDGTIDICQKLSDNRWHILKGPSKGVTSNFENALKHAKGEVIITSDQDDVWLLNRVKDILPLLSLNQLVLCNAYVVDQNLKKSGGFLFDHLHLTRSLVPLLFRNCFVGACLAFRRDLLTYCLPFPYPSILLHDVWIGACAILRDSVYFLETPLILYRRHSSSTSATASSRRLTIWIAVRGLFYRATLFIAFFSRLFSTLLRSKLR